MPLGRVVIRFVSFRYHHSIFMVCLATKLVCGNINSTDLKHLNVHEEHKSCVTKQNGLVAVN